MSVTNGLQGRITSCHGHRRRVLCKVRLIVYFLGQQTFILSLWLSFCLNDFALLLEVYIREQDLRRRENLRVALISILIDWFKFPYGRMGRSDLNPFNMANSVLSILADALVRSVVWVRPLEWFWFKGVFVVWQDRFGIELFFGHCTAQAGQGERCWDEISCRKFHHFFLLFHLLISFLSETFIHVAHKAVSVGLLFA